MDNSNLPESTIKPVILDVKRLCTHFLTPKGRIQANKNVSIQVEQGAILGIVGESGSGKSVLCRSILRLLPNPPAETTDGEIWFDGQDLRQLSEDDMQHIRGRSISMIFQDPMTCLNPVYQVGEQITESLLLHDKISRTQAREIALELLHQVGIPSPEKRLISYPHQLSGGMRQRVMIAMAIAAKPKLLLADEPTTALDVTIQDQILALMLDLQAKVGMSVILVSHDLGIVAETSDRVVVMYAGQVMEQASTKAIFYNPRHPYTKGLLLSIPRMEGAIKHLAPIPGSPPNLANLPSGCPFVDRCKVAVQEICSITPISLNEVEPGHYSACLYPERIN